MKPAPAATMNPQTAPEVVAKDASLTNAEVSAQVEITIASLVKAERDLSNRPLFQIVDNGPKGQRVEDRSCSFDAAEGTTTVIAVSQVQKERSRILNRLTTSNGQVEREETSYIWSKPGVQILCNDVETDVKLLQSEREGLRLETTFKRELKSIVRQRGDKDIVAAQRNTFSEGANQFTWQSVRRDGQSLRITKTVNLDMRQGVAVINDGKADVYLDAILKTPADQPLVIEEQRDLQTQRVASRTVQSGKVVSTRSSGGRLELRFEKVVYTQEKRCQAVSGKLYGDLYGRSGASPLLSFSVDFSAADNDSSTLALTAGKVSLALDGCSFDDPEKVSVRRLRWSNRR